jgi:hypothetical protein
VDELLLSAAAAAAVDRTSSELLVASLAEAVRRPLRPRAFGEPCPEEVALAAEAQLHDRLPPGHPARQLYATLRDQAHGGYRHRSGSRQSTGGGVGKSHSRGTGGGLCDRWWH